MEKLTIWPSTAELRCQPNAGNTKVEITSEREKIYAKCTLVQIIIRPFAATTQFAHDGQHQLNFEL